MPLHVDVASRAPHHRKHGATFAETWTLADGTTIVAVGAVLAGKDRYEVSDLVRTGARAVVTSRAALVPAIASLDRIVQKHAREHRDDELAVSLVLVAVPRDGNEIALAAAGPIHAALIDGAGERQAIYAHGAALGTGERAAIASSYDLRRDDVLVIATSRIPDWGRIARDASAAAILQRIGAEDVAAVVAAAA
jgi:hypothetical protein